MVSSKVKVETFRGLYRIVVSKSISPRRYISTGLSTDVGANLTKVQNVKLRIESDIVNGCIDPTLEKYKALFKTTTAATATIDIRTLWNRFCESKRPTLAETTYKVIYKGVYQNVIEYHLREFDLEDTKGIESKLTEELAPFRVREVLTMLNSMCEWALNERLIDKSVFAGRAASYPKRNYKNTLIDPFDPVEKQRILSAFQQRAPSYFPFVRFFTLTGARPGEISGLRWKHVARDLSYVIFAESYNPQLRLFKDTKTHQTRRFDCNRVLRDFLGNFPRRKPDDTVFHIDGNVINQVYLSREVWLGHPPHRNGVVQTLVENGELKRYRKLYNLRHTAITEMIDAGLNVPLVAKLTGTSSTMIVKHYCGTKLQGDIPLW